MFLLFILVNNIQRFLKTLLFCFVHTFFCIWIFVIVLYQSHCTFIFFIRYHCFSPWLFCMFFVHAQHLLVTYYFVGICNNWSGNIKSGFLILFRSAIIVNKTPLRKKLRAIIHKQSPRLTV